MSISFRSAGHPRLAQANLLVLRLAVDYLPGRRAAGLWAWQVPRPRQWAWPKPPPFPLPAKPA